MSLFLLFYFFWLELRFLFPWWLYLDYFELAWLPPLIILSPTIFEALLFYVLLYLLWPKCSPDIFIELYEDPLNWVAVVTLPKVRDELPLNPLICFFPWLLFANIFLGVMSLVLLIWLAIEDGKTILPPPAPFIAKLLLFL